MFEGSAQCSFCTLVKRELFYSMGWGLRRCSCGGGIGPNMKMNESRLRCKMWPFLASLARCATFNMQVALPHYVVEHVPTVIRFQTGEPPFKEISVNLCFCRI